MASTTLPPSGADVESQQRDKNNHVSHLSLVFNPSRVTPEVLEYEYSGEGTQESPYMVDFLPQDAHNPMQYPQWKKWTITALQAVATLAVAFASTAYSGGIFQVIRDFHISQELAILGISLFVCGFAIGPLLWAPLSEFYGRQLLFCGTYFALTAFNAGAAGAQNIQTLVILRFFAGAFGSSPLTNSGGVIADMFTANERGIAAGVFATAPFLGPSIGPIAGGFLGDAAGWRWVEGLMAIFTGVLWVACTFFVPETYAPVLLRNRAAKLHKMTGKMYVSKYDAANWKNKDRKGEKAKQIKTALLRPWILLFCEPIVLLTSIYMAIVYGTLYLMFAAFPIVFQGGRGWSAGIGGLAFLGVAVGMMAGVGYAVFDNLRYARVAAAHGGNAPPEARLPPAIIGSVLLPVGLFWFAWTNGPEVHWIVPIIASGFFAAGLVLVFLSLMTYLIDSYTIFAASVLASNAVLRSLFGAAFPLFTTYMYKDLGIHWASTIPAFLALACMPFPFLFHRYGGQIRMRCKYAAEAAEVLVRMRAQNQLEPTITEAEAAEEAVVMAELRKSMSRVSRARTKSNARRGSTAAVVPQPPTLLAPPKTATSTIVSDDEDEDGTVVGSHNGDSHDEKMRTGTADS
ncbi:major facilitator superfamily domain-containing protein [Podospora didyma]|uniref:Major facilitator superfamily domain-containing protein n=1 Tax=Podospora didyma TaxID=330526 RepID=A0AAE0KFV0_9PEZI|nr:major facilitator superfamily domain-containing protein [Podospora didyma]